MQQLAKDRPQNYYRQLGQDFRYANVDKELADNPVAGLRQQQNNFGVQLKREAEVAGDFFQGGDALAIDTDED